MKRRGSFGYEVIGPILADMLLQTYTRLQEKQPSVVFFCSRGGLLLRHALQVFARSVNLDLQFPCQDFMVSRLTAFRAAFQIDPQMVGALINREFAGRTCGEAVRALWDIEISDHDACDSPFSMTRLLEMLRGGDLGRRVQAFNDEQASLLRDHIDQLRCGHRSITLCDTGVYGSILRYLQVGVPEIDWRLVLLYRADYKRLDAPHFGHTTGAVSESNVYLPWSPRTAALLYWPFFEALFEPSLPSVREYNREFGSRTVVSNLQIEHWKQASATPPNCICADAFDYLRELTPEQSAAIRTTATRAWNHLRRLIVFPTRENVEQLQVGARSLDFGTKESVSFTAIEGALGKTMREKRLLAAASIWPEGELRKQLPHLASPFLFAAEMSRWLRALALRRD